jgi:uncharacterized delta-60 repeat protein
MAMQAIGQVPFDLDTSYRTVIDVQYVNSVQPLSDGKLLISGRVRLPGENFYRGSARLLSDGELDGSFPPFPLTTGNGEIVRWMDGYYVGTGGGVRRLDGTGLIDPTFILMNDGPYFTSLQGGDYHVCPDGRVLMSGAHMLDDPIRGFQGLYSLIWFSNTGYLDTTRTHRFCNGVIYEIEEQPDGKFLCTGTMTTYEGQPVSRVFRVEADGTLDTSFNMGLQPYGEAFEYHTLPDARVLIGGAFRLNGSDQIQSLLRVHSDGSLDESFTLNVFEETYSNAQIPIVLGILPLGNGYIITGTFDKINGQDRGGIAMVDLDGNLLPEPFNGLGCGGFQDGVTFRKGLAGIAPTADGNFYIYGSYHGYDDGTTNDTTQRMVSRLYGLEVGVRQTGIGSLSVYPNPTSYAFTVSTPRPLQGGVLHLVDAAGRRVQSWNWPSDSVSSELHVRGIPAGQYTLALDAQHIRVLGKLSILPE